MHVDPEMKISAPVKLWMTLLGVSATAAGATYLGFYRLDRVEVTVRDNEVQSIRRDDAMSARLNATEAKYEKFVETLGRIDERTKQIQEQLQQQANKR